MCLLVQMLVQLVFCERYSMVATLLDKTVKASGKTVAYEGVFIFYGFKFVLGVVSQLLYVFGGLVILVFDVGKPAENGKQTAYYSGDNGYSRADFKYNSQCLHAIAPLFNRSLQNNKHVFDGHTAVTVRVKPLALLVGQFDFTDRCL